jgi:hypothetical protein
MRNIFYVKKGTAWRFKGIESLKSIRLAVSSGYTYDGEGPLDTYIKQSTAPAVQFGAGDAPLVDNIGKPQEQGRDEQEAGGEVHGTGAGRQGLGAKWAKWIFGKAGS